VFIVDSDRHVRPMNEAAKQLWSAEGISEQQLERAPAHPLSRLIKRLLDESYDSDDAMILQLGDGARYEIIHSMPSSKGKRWMMLMLRPFPMVLAVDREALRKRWHFTSREAEVAAACIAGRTSAEMCEQLGISRETLKTHISRVLLKTDCDSRSQLVDRVLFGSSS
jgi:DNA-binding CsgD family transcriptional regulator